MDTLQDLVKSLENKQGTALSWKEGKMSYNELYGKINALSKGLNALGLQSGDKISVFSKNLPEWIMVSLGINNAGMIDVPRGEDNTSEDLAYIINHSESKIVIVDDESTLKKISDKIEPTRVYTIRKVEGSKNISEIIDLGMKSDLPIAKITPDQTASIIYTSGTTGNPKGVELTHKNFASNMEAVLKRLPITSADKNMSILPAWHTFERIAKYVFLAIGCETFYTTQLSLMNDLETQKPTVLASVPRIWEAVYGRMIKLVKEKGEMKSAMFDKMFDMAVNYSDNGGFFNKKAFEYLEKEVFQEIRRKLGGNLRFAVSGGSGLPKHIEDFFRIAKINILEGYGMTETSPVIAARSFTGDDRYSVGKPLENLEIRISEEGVLHVKGPSVMKGYYKNPDATKEVLSGDGWLNTGDLAHINKDGCLVITGRAKDLIKLSNGEYVNPAAIELSLKNSSYIDSIVVVGQDAKNLGALIVPNLDMIGMYCKNHKIEFAKNDPELMKATLQRKEIRSLFDSELKKYSNTNAGFKNYELVREYILLPTPFSVGKELTASMKVKRRAVEQLYKQEINVLLGK